MNNNIVFQVIDHTQEDPSWHNSKIVYVLEDVSPNYDVTHVADVISVLTDNSTVRYSRLEIGESVSLQNVNRKNGGYYQHR